MKQRSSLPRSRSVAAWAITARQRASHRPIIVCLYGSPLSPELTQRFIQQETLAGKIVVPWGMEWTGDAWEQITERDHLCLEELTRRKIDLADEALFLNIGGLLDELPLQMLDYARDQQKRIRFLERRLQVYDLHMQRWFGIDVATEEWIGNELPKGI